MSTSTIDKVHIDFPPKKISIGKFSISEDYEILIIFKDSIGIYSPNFSLVEKPETVCGNIEFLAAQKSRPTTPIRLDVTQSENSAAGDSTSAFDLDAVRYALGFVNRTVQAMETRSLECRNFLDHAFRWAEWSPIGLDEFNRCMFACVTGNNQFFLCGRTIEKWSCMVNLSNYWHAYWCENGMRLLREKTLKFILTTDWKYEAEVIDRGHKKEVVCTNVPDFYSGVMDNNIVSASWSRRVRKVKNKMSGLLQNCLLAGLHQSGTISFWDILAPCYDIKKIRLLAIERTFFVPYEIPKMAAKPNFIKICDFDTENFILVIGFTDGKIIGNFYKAYAMSAGALTMLKRETVTFTSALTPFVSVSDANYCNQSRLLAIGFGTRAIISKISIPPDNKQSIRMLTRLHPIECICKSISGVRIFQNNVYISAFDGLIANFTVSTMSNTIAFSPLNIICQQSSNPGNFHKSYSGLFLSPNLAHVAFLEIAVAPAYCNIPSYMTFVSLKSQPELLALLKKATGPIRMQLDLLQELDRLLACTETIHAQLNTSVDMDKEDGSQTFASLQDQILTQTMSDVSRVDLQKLQLWRAESVLFMRSSSTETETQEGLKNLIRRLDVILALRQVDKCFRLFLKTEIQRQASDCIMIKNISHLCVAYLDRPEIANEIGDMLLSTTLKKAALVIENVASKLYTQRFGKSEKDFADSGIYCCICKSKVLADLFSCVCPKGHTIPRCSNSFRPCIDAQYCECPSCKRCSTLILSIDRPSQWKREVNSRFCAFCNIRVNFVWF